MLMCLGFRMCVFLKINSHLLEYMKKGITFAKTKRIQMMAIDDLIERYANFYTDFAFKKLFGTEANKDLLVSFLNSLLDGKETITDLTYLNSENLGSTEFDRKAVFDVYCENEKGEKFLIEMQKAEQQFFKDRSVFYSTFPIRDQAEKGNWNYQMKAVYTIGILNFSFDDDDPEYFHHEVKLMDTRTKEVFYDKLTYIYLEMPKFTKTVDELENMFEKWLFAIRHLPDLMERPSILSESVFVRFFEQAEIAKFNRKERMEYEGSLKNYRDWYSIMKTAEYKSREEGRAEGLAEGLAEGITKGKQEIALNMKNEGIDDTLIAKMTGLSIDEINKL